METSKHKSLPLILGGALGGILVFVLGNYLGAVFSAAPLESFILSIIVLFFGFISWLLFCIMAHSFFVSI